MSKIDKAIEELITSAELRCRSQATEFSQLTSKDCDDRVQYWVDRLKQLVAPGAMATTANPGGTGVALYRVRRDGDDEMPGMIPKWVEGAPTPADIATFTDRGYRVECVYWDAPANGETWFGTELNPDGILTLTVRNRPDGAVLHQTDVDLRHTSITEATQTEIEGIRSTLVIAANNPSSHGSERGLIRIMKDQATRLGALLGTNFVAKPAPQSPREAAEVIAQSIITDLSLRLHADADKELMGEFAERIRSLVAAQSKGKVPQSWLNQEVRERENAAARAMQMEDRLAGIAAALGVGPRGDEIEARIAGMATPAAAPGAVERAFDLGFEWRQMLQGHVNDGRDVGRTLTALQFEQIGVNAGVISGLDSKEQAIVTAKAEIKRALAAIPARGVSPPATEGAPVTNLPEGAIVWHGGDNPVSWNTLVTVWSRRSSTPPFKVLACDVDWSWTGGDGDVFAYRIEQVEFGPEAAPAVALNHVPANDLPMHVGTMLQASAGALERIAEAGYNAWCDDPEAWQTVNKMERKRWLIIARASIMELFKDTGVEPIIDA